MPDCGPFGARHRTAREALFASQRGRMEEAIADAACDKGLADTTVADVVKRARVSRRTFYEHYRDKDDCFLEAYRTAMQFVIARLDAERDRVDTDDWRARVRAGLEAYVGTVEEEPRFARFVLVESRAGDHRVAELRSEIYARLTDQYVELNDLAVRQDPDARRVHRGLLMLLVAGLADVSAEHVRRGEVDVLRDMLEPLVVLHVTVVSGRIAPAPAPALAPAMAAAAAASSGGN